MVRAMHAFSRAQYFSRGGGTEDYGVPINAVDMLRTWFDFTYVSYRALHNMGYEVADEQIRDVYYFWRVVGRVLGIPHDLLEGLDDHDSSEETVAALSMVAGEPNDDSRALVDALVDAAAGQLAVVLQLPKEPLAERTQAHIRIIHGDELADQLEVPRRSIQVAEMLSVPLARQAFNFLQMLPAERQREIAANEVMIAQLLQMTDDGESAYETAPSEGATSPAP